VVTGVTRVPVTCEIHYAITDQRVIRAKGIVIKTQKGLPLEMVEDAGVMTVLGEGGVNVSTAGRTMLSQLRIFPMKTEEARRMSEMIIDLRNKTRAASGLPPGLRFPRGRIGYGSLSVLTVRVS
jgi:hypothetical protein